MRVSGIDSPFILPLRRDGVPACDSFAPIPARVTRALRLSSPCSRQMTKGDDMATVVRTIEAPRQEVAPASNDIEVEGLVREFKGGIRAIDGIDLRVKPGEIYGFLGPNGAGKSTTVHALTTLLPPTSGRVEVAGLDVVKQAARVRALSGAGLQAVARDLHLAGRE